MTRSMKVFGAGSIGNHLTNAARRLGWDVHLCDPDPDALRRTREEIYPSRYGAWDDAIGLSTVDEAPTGQFDLIVVGTPPDVHLDVAMTAIEERPRAILVEKPVCRPDLDRAQEVVDACAEHGIRAFVGYDHVVGQGVQAVGQTLATGTLGDILTLDVEFREHWGGIFAAHPWLPGPHASYLGYWRRGGGASGEHSHAANLWQHLAQAAGTGAVVEVNACLDYVQSHGADYDQVCLLNLRTEAGLVGRVVQDVITQPHRKWLRAQGSLGAVEWTGTASRDTVTTFTDGGEDVVTIEKSRPDDFVAELAHIDHALSTGEDSPIDLTAGLDTMLVIAAAHLSHAEQRTVTIDRSRGYTPAALKA